MKFKSPLFSMAFAPMVLILAVFSAGLSSCSDDAPPQRTEYDIVGIYKDNDNHFLDLADPDHIYDYTLLDFDDMMFWEKRKLMYLYEPNSNIMLKEDLDGNMQVYKVIDYDSEGITWCWVDSAASSSSGEDGEDPALDIFRVFFVKDYVTDPAKYEHLTKISQEEFKKALGDIEVID